MKAIFIFPVLIGLSVCSSIYDKDAVIEEPCKDAVDFKKCVRKYFARHATGGSLIKTLDDDPVIYKGDHYGHVPTVGATFLLHDPVISNLNGTIEAFYINKKTNNLVMSVYFEKLHVDTDATFYIHRRSKEPIIIDEKAYGTHEVVLTAVITLNKGPITKKIMDDSLITANFPHDSVAFYIGPKLSESKDSTVASAHKSVFADTQAVISELFLTGAHYFFNAFVHKYIYDFGYPFVAAPKVATH